MNETTRRNALLLEAVVALTLTAVLLTALLGMYRRVHSLGDHKQLEPIWAECSLQHNLSHIATGITSILAIEDEELVCFFDNGIDRDPHFSAEVLARLYRDSSGRFVAALWPSPKHWQLETPPCRQIVLASGIESLSWVEHHKRESLPAMLEVILNDRSLLFAVHASKSYPLYTK